MKPTLPEPEVLDRHLPTNTPITRGYTWKTVQRLIDEAYAAGLEDAAADLIETRAQRQAAFRTIESLQDQLSAERMRIKDGIMALAMTAERCEDDGPEVQTAIKAFAFRVGLMIDGHDDLVMNDAAKSFFGSLLETRVYQHPTYKDYELKKMRQYVDKIIQDPEGLKDFLTRAGIVDENGELAEPYQPIKDTR